MNRRKLEKKVKPILVQFAILEDKYFDNLPILDLKDIGIGFAEQFSQLIQVCGEFGFSKARIYLQVCCDLKAKINDCRDLKILQQYVFYLRHNFHDLVKVFDV